MPMTKKQVRRKKFAKLLGVLAALLSMSDHTQESVVMQAIAKLLEEQINY